jgi:DNA-binding winged helix-turn-helix (wHTH) protein/tetratricopeptide (TPR) repeat protein
MQAGGEESSKGVQFPFKKASKPSQTVTTRNMMDTGRVLLFGPYRLQVDLGRLLRDDQPVPLTPKAFDVLLALIERRDRVVDKAELMKVVWPDSFVEEANLSQTIFVLRKTLGEQPDGQRFIETVPRRGYRFVAEVEEEAGPAARGVTPAAADRWLRWGRAAPVAAVFIVTVAVAGWRIAVDVPASGMLDEKTRIVILPFENLTTDRADDWLAGAFSDSLTSGLQVVETLIPVSRDRIVELYRREGIREAAALDAGALRRVTDALRVRYFVHGSYQKVGDQIRVSARLVAADSGAIEAQESVTDDFVNLLKVEDDLAERFARQLQAGMRTGHTRVQRTSIESYQSFIEGRTLYAQTRHGDAVDPLTRATMLDPLYAPAWALRGKNQARLATITVISSGDVSDLRREALEHAQRAVKLAPDLYDARVALSLAHREMEEYQQSRAEALTAIEQAPQLAEAYELVADSYSAANAWGCARDRDAPLAERHFQMAIRLDPLWAAPYANLSYHFSWSGREDDALRIADQGLAILPNNPTITRARALTLVRLGRPDDAERAIRQVLAAGSPMSGQDHLVLGSVALERGNAVAASHEFDTASARLPTTITLLAIARAYLDARQLEAGLSHLDRAVALDSSCAQFAATTPAFSAHRDAVEFRTRLARWLK